ncbi:MAG: hypothetical protein V4649_15290 [Bacteroidota bacterium]
MKRIIRLLPILALAVILLAGCSKNTPKDVAETWLTGFNHMDFESARSVSTDDTKRLLSELEQLTDKVADSNKKELKKIIITVKNVKVDSNKAVATYITSDNPGRDQALNLVKVNEKWLVQFSKVDLMGVPAHQDDAPIEGEGQAQADSLSNSSMDTSKSNQ